MKRKQGQGWGGARGKRHHKKHSDSGRQLEVKVKLAHATGQSNVRRSSSSEEEEEYKEPTSPRTTLLQTLLATNESFAKTYASWQRKHGEIGDDDEEAGCELEDEDESKLENELDEDESRCCASSLSKTSEEDSKDSDMGEAEEVAEEAKYDEDSDSKILSTGANAGTCEDPFKTHLELELADTKIAELVEGKAKFKFEFNVPGLPTGRWLSNISTFPKVEKDLANCAVKELLLKHWRKRPGHKHFGDFHSEGQAQFFSLCNNYEDILFTQRCGLQSSVASNEEHQAYVDAYVLHILNHVLKTRDLVTKNNEKLHRQEIASSGNGKKDADFIDPPRDQGFTRPKVLILLPYRSTALKFVKQLIALAPKSQTVDIEHKARFFDDFGVESDEDDKEVNHDGNGEERKENNGYKGGKPADHEALFNGNNDDHFRIGIKFTRRSIKLYSDFYSSDIIVASPLGLVTKIGEEESTKKENNVGVDFLSSIEIVVMDYTDVICMQNWLHVVTLFNHLNRIPQSQHSTDIMRIREWFLNGHSRHYRQTLILSTFSSAKINAIFHRSCVNHAGKVKLNTQHQGVLSKVMLNIRQVFNRIECEAITEDDDARFDHFTKQVFPRVKDSQQGGILLLASSKLDFPRLRKFLKDQNASFCEIHEETRYCEISRRRSWFYHNKRHIMLYSERAHFYHRYKIKGIRELIIYSLPHYAHFYLEVAANLRNGFSSCTVTFSKFDKFQLERIVGSTYAKQMIESKKGMFTFM